jgi:sugar/nucleoside kinase (ribokinase family)
VAVTSLPPSRATAPDGRSVWVVGNLTTDLIIHDVEALPSWGREVAGRGHVSVAAGQAAYLAFGLARLGVAASIVGVVGDDDPGAALCAELAAAGVETGAIETASDAPTAITVALVRPDGERAFVSDFACQHQLDAAFVTRNWPTRGRAHVLCLVGLFNLPALTPASAMPLFARARAEGLLTVLDTGWDPSQWPAPTVARTRELLAQTDVFLPNLEEAEALTGLRDAEAAAIALERDGAGTVVIKCGRDGALGRAKGATERVPALNVVVHDAVGAGDSFDAGFVFATLEGHALRDCMEFATATAAAYISRTTARYPAADEVRDAVSGMDRPVAAKRAQPATETEAA